MQNLTRGAGLAVAVDLTSGKLSFGDGTSSDPPIGRALADLVSVLADPTAGGPDPAYLLYRDVRTSGDGARLADAGLRYDLTVTRPGTIGSEYVKTAGHFHRPEASGFCNPEVYEVLHGRAAFLLQRWDQGATGSPSIVEGWIVLAGRGDVILIPGHLGHVTINLGTVPLVVSDLVAASSRNDYRAFQENRGAAWYVEPEPLSPVGFRLRSNPHYPTGPLPRITTAASFSSGVANGLPLYRRAVGNPAEFHFLVAIY